MPWNGLGSKSTWTVLFPLTELDRKVVVLFTTWQSQFSSDICGHWCHPDLTCYRKNRLYWGVGKTKICKNTNVPIWTCSINFLCYTLVRLVPCKASKQWMHSKCVKKELEFWWATKQLWCFWVALSFKITKPHPWGWSSWSWKWTGCCKTGYLHGEKMLKGKNRSDYSK